MFSTKFYTKHLYFFPFFLCIADRHCDRMTAPGTEIFNASGGYDADMWDDSALIRQYDQALQSSR